MRALIDAEGSPLGYYVSSVGEVHSSFSGRLLKPYIGPNGYPYVTFRDNKKRYVHRLVAEAYLGLDPSVKGLEVNHLNFDRSDCRLSNLEVVTPSQNKSHAHTRLNRKRFGSYHHTNSKLSGSQAREIYKSPLSQRALAREYGVSSRAIHNIKNGISYSWATKEGNVHALSD